MPLNNAFDIGQAQTRAFKICRYMQALKYAEQLVRIRHVKARTVVLNNIRCLPVGLDFTCNADTGIIPSGAVLSGIFKQVLHGH